MFESVRDVEYGDCEIVCRCRGRRFGMLLWDWRRRTFRYEGSCNENALCAIIKRAKFLAELHRLHQCLIETTPT